MTKHHLVDNRTSRLTDEAAQGDDKKTKQKSKKKGSGGGELVSKAAEEPPRSDDGQPEDLRIIETCLIGMSSG
jgi:hypothetical protein